MKLADVGVAKHEKEITGTMIGTSLYLAPEVFEGRVYNSKADMFLALYFGKYDMVSKPFKRP